MYLGGGGLSYISWIHVCCCQYDIVGRCGISWACSLKVLSLNNVFILTLGTGNALYQPNIKTHNDFFLVVMQLRPGNFYFMEMAIKFTMWRRLNRCVRAWESDNYIFMALVSYFTKIGWIETLVLRVFFFTDNKGKNRNGVWHISLFTAFQTIDNQATTLDSHRSLTGFIFCRESTSFTIPSSVAMRIIGHKGTRIKELQEQVKRGTHVFVEILDFVNF
jgi:hypothetical protein